MIIARYLTHFYLIITIVAVSLSFAENALTDKSQCDSGSQQDSFYIPQTPDSLQSLIDSSENLYDEADTSESGLEASQDSTSDSLKTNPDSSKLQVQTKKQKHKSLQKNAELYPGVSSEQDKYARQIVRAFFSLQWDDAQRAAEKMQRIETRDHLPPLSYLLMVSGRVFRLQNGEYEDQKDYSQLLNEIYNLSQKGLKYSNPRNSPDSVLATNLLIYSGIKGFVATMKLSKNPIEAALEGLSALRILEKLIEIKPQVKDAYLGLGIFYCALSKAPGIIKSALNIGRRDITLNTGIEYLRISASQGRYTSPTAKLYLIQFLSPYYGHMVEEKYGVFKSLQSDFPKNPNFVFLENEENLCFHQERITERYKQNLKKKIKSFKSGNYCMNRYINLLKWQYSSIDIDYGDGLKPDSKFNLREYSFYPVFLEALRYQLYISSGENIQAERNHKQLMVKKGNAAIKILESSEMSSHTKNVYLWHIRDVMRDK
jgi:hypothetical protein